MPHLPDEFVIGLALFTALVGVLLLAARALRGARNETAPDEDEGLRR